MSIGCQPLKRRLELHFVKALRQHLMLSNWKLIIIRSRLTGLKTCVIGMNEFLLRVQFWVVLLGNKAGIVVCDGITLTGHGTLPTIFLNNAVTQTAHPYHLDFLRQTISFHCCFVFGCEGGEGHSGSCRFYSMFNSPEARWCFLRLYSITAFKFLLYSNYWFLWGLL